jgi:hypothetical protein
VHIHALVLDGVYVEDAWGGLAFHALAAPTDEAMARVLAVVAARIRRLLERHGHGEAGPDDRAEDAWGGDAAGLAGVAAASVQGRAALGSRAGARTRRIGSSRELLAWWTPPRWSCHAQHDGYDLHARGPGAGAGSRAAGARLSLFVAAATGGPDRVQRADDGDIILALRHSCHLRALRFGVQGADGTTHLRFDPIELLERLAALIPRPRINLVLYYGVLGAHAAWRSRVCPGTRTGTDRSPGDGRASTGAEALDAARRHGNMLWAELMQRSFGFDPLVCACGGRLRLLAVIEAPRVIRRILTHLGLPTEVPAARPPRAPPLSFDEPA